MRRRTSSVLTALVAGLSAGSGSCNPAPLGPAPTPWVDLTPARDQSPDPQIVEVSIEAREATKTYSPGRTTAVLTYNGTVPGPLIEANVGDELIVHFQNSLSMDTTIHWHGVRVPNAMDGTMAVQAPVGP